MKLSRAFGVAVQMAAFLVMLGLILYVGGCDVQKVGPSLEQDAAHVKSTDAAFGQTTANGKETSDQRGSGTVTALDFGKDGKTTLKSTGQAIAVVSIPGIGQVMSGRDFTGKAAKIYQPGVQDKDGNPALLAEGVELTGTASTATAAFNEQVATLATMVTSLAPAQRDVAIKELEAIAQTTQGVTHEIIQGVLAMFPHVPTVGVPSAPAIVTPPAVPALPAVPAVPALPGGN